MFPYKELDLLRTRLAFNMKKFLGREREGRRNPWLHHQSKASHALWIRGCAGPARTAQRTCLAAPQSVGADCAPERGFFNIFHKSSSEMITCTASHN